MAGRASWLGKVLKPNSDSIAAAFGQLEKFLAPEADRAERKRVSQFAAYRWDGSGLAQDAVRDISSSGLYLVTRERWQTGTILTLTLQREGPLDLDPSRRITTQAKVVRSGPDGVGLTFLWSKEDPKSRQWENLLECLIEQTRPADMQSLVRMVDAFAFLGRICPDGVDEIGEWVRNRAVSHKVLNAVSIALKADILLGRSSRAYANSRINPLVAVRVLEIGSSCHEDWLQGYWAGLLISSISASGSETTNLELIELFSQLTTIPTRIFTVVCTKSTKFLSQSGSVAARPLECNTEELATTVGARGPQLGRDLATLASLQLVERGASDSPSLLRNSTTKVTPTPLGLQLFALCNGHRGKLQDFYLEHSPETVPATA
jgi:hypothetical protein